MVKMEEDVDVAGADKGESKPNVSSSRALGLHDLYKAAFCQEASIMYETSKAPETEPYLYDEAGNRLIKVEGTENMYQYLQPSEAEEKLAFTSSVITEGHNIQVDVNGHFTLNNTMLDLDKGIPVHVVRATMSNINTTDQMQGNIVQYQGDPQILQRYLNDSASLINNDDDLSHFLIKKTPVVIDDGQPGVNPDVFGVRYEDCEFNSSDSFASIESIIPKNIQCPKCPKRFMFKSDLLKHDKHKHAVKQKMSCNYCNKVFVSQQNLIFHEKSHKKKNKHTKCDQCSKSFKKAGFLVKHIKKKHSSNITACFTCLETFPNEETLKEHQKHCGNKSNLSSSEPSSFKCKICDSVFFSKQSLQIHENSEHVGEASFVCQRCNKSFSKLCRLKSHMRSHVEMLPGVEIPFLCEFCCKPFSCQAELMNHVKKHEKNFICPVCSKNFASKSSLKNHMIKKHSDFELFVCEMCSKSFALETDLEKHKKTHEKTKRFSCSNCKRDFSQHSSYVAHWKNKTCEPVMLEEGTQTNEGEMCPNTIVFTEDNNVNIIVDPSALSSDQPILLTALGGYTTATNTIPMIISSSTDLESIQS